MSVFSDIKPRNSAPRNAFDLSRRSVFSTKCGYILPVFTQATLPNSQYKIDVNQLLRTQPLDTAAFTGFSINYDFVFVPNNHSYTSFNQFIAQRSNKNMVRQPSNTQIPTFDLFGFISGLLPFYIYDKICTQFSRTEWYNYMQDDQTFNYLSITSNLMPDDSVVYGIIRQLDLFGYGNYLPICEHLWDSFKSYCLTEEGGDISTLAGCNTVFQNWNPQSMTDIYNSIWTILTSQLFISDYSNFNIQSQFDYTDGQLLPNLWPVLAYNKAFHEYYRNVYYDTSFSLITSYGGSSPIKDWEYVHLFNMDDWSNVYNALDVVNYYTFWRLIAMFAIKPHLYRKDLFTGVLPSTQFGDVSVMVDDRSWLNLMYKDSAVPSTYDDGLKLQRSNVNANAYIVTTNPFDGSNYGGQNTDNSGKFRFDPALAISVLESRRADAMQRFKERMLRAGDKTKDVFKAHGWDEPLSESSFEPVFLGSFDGRLDINTVAATTKAGEQDLGQLGANGVAVVQGNQINFKSKDFGYIIGLMYIVKDSEIDSYGVERHLQLTEAFDYPYPELQNISLAPISKLELTSYNQSAGSISTADFSEIVGYLPRFMEFKTALDKVHGEFYSAPRVLGATTWGEPFDNMSRQGVFSNWVTPKLDVNSVDSVAFLYQQPDIDRNVFTLTGYNQDTDHFLVNAQFTCYAVEPLSVIGLPM